jgi:hypothetical protein
MASHDVVVPSARRADWNRVGAIAQIVGVIIGAATLFLMWWLDRQAHTQAREGEPTLPVAWWMPVLIAGTLLLTGFLHYRAVWVARRPGTNQRQPMPDQSETLGRLNLEIASLQSQLAEARDRLAHWILIEQESLAKSREKYRC